VICQGFIDYFEQRDQLEDRLSGAAKSAMTLSYRDMLIFFLVGKEKERQHLLPSATLWKNSSMDSEAQWLTQQSNAHRVQQWRKSDGELSLIPKHYRYTL
jgi:hypothetical protein